MFDSLRNRTLGELIDQGWVVMVDEETDEIIGVRSIIRHWHTLTWAEQTYYRSKYGFSENGILDISLYEHDANTSKLGLALRPPVYGRIVVPDESLPGSNDRLQTILSRSRVAVENNRYDETALVHFGPDGTVIHTYEYLWGIEHPKDIYYAELDPNYICNWEISIATWCPTAPWWALGPDAAELYETS